MEDFRRIFYDNWFGFTCPRIRTRDRHLFTQLRTFRFHLTRGISWTIRWLLAYYYGIGCMRLILPNCLDGKYYYLSFSCKLETVPEDGRFQTLALYHSRSCSTDLVCKLVFWSGIQHYSSAMVPDDASRRNVPRRKTLAILSRSLYLRICSCIFKGTHKFTRLFIKATFLLDNFCNPS